MSTILVVDDEPAICHMLRLALARCGHQAVVCADGQSAVDALAACSFAVALIDLNLPRIAGMRVFEAVRAARPDLPVVVMSGAFMDGEADSSDLLATSAAAPKAHLLPKPFRASALMPLLEMLIASRPEGPAGFDRKSA